MLDQQPERTQHMTQNQKLLQHFVEGKEITRLEAMFVFGIQNITARINDLRTKYGIEINTDIRNDSNGAEYAAYSLSSRNFDRLHACAELADMKRRSARKSAAMKEAA
jgi:hypothetical protein